MTGPTSALVAHASDAAGPLSERATASTTGGSCPRCGHVWTYESGACPFCVYDPANRPRLLELAACEGGATAGYRAAGWHVTAVDLDEAALKRNPADEAIVADALSVLTKAWFMRDFDAIHASFPCQHWAANGGNAAKAKWPDLITPGRELLNATGLPWVMENVLKAPLRRDLILCGSMFDLTAEDTDGTTLHLRRHRVFESNVPLTAPRPCQHPRGVQWAGVYGGARKDKHEARAVRHGGYVPPDAEVQSALLGGVPWMTGKGRRECIPPMYAEHVGRQLREHVTDLSAAFDGPRWDCGHDNLGHTCGPDCKPESAAPVELAGVSR